MWCIDPPAVFAENLDSPDSGLQDARCFTSTWVVVAQEATKQQSALSPQSHFRGYQGLGANVTRYEGGFARDHHEGLDFYKDVPVSLTIFVANTTQKHSFVVAAATHHLLFTCYSPSSRLAANRRIGARNTVHNCWL